MGGDALGAVDPTGKIAIAPLIIWGLPIIGGGWWLTHRDPISISKPIPFDECKNPECQRANKWELLTAGITDAEKYKRENGAVPISRYDICKCNDGSIRIAAVGQCGKTNHFWN